MLHILGLVGQYGQRNAAPLVLVAISLASRLPLLSISLEEVDSGNFYNSLKYGYDIADFRPHAPGYPVYVFMGWLLLQALGDPLLSLTTLSAFFGSLAVAPFYFLLRELAGIKIALLGSLLFMVNPLQWSFSEAALSDVPSTFFVLLAVWLVYVGRRNGGAFLVGCLAMALAVGVRQANICLVPLLAFPLAYRYVVDKEIPWKLAATGAAVFLTIFAAWFFPGALLGSGGFSEYFGALDRQWSSAVRVYDISHLESPWLLNLAYRLERFFLGYYVVYPWTGTDSKTALNLLLVAPWLFGFALFISGFRINRPSHLLLLLWLLSIIYPVLTIHFLPLSSPACWATSFSSPSCDSTPGGLRLFP
jgi:4-amino-4-deoxy-L-arabinose transferase-like glycosyltransferase